MDTPSHRQQIYRSCDEKRSGTLEVISGKGDAKFEIIAVPGLGAHPYHKWERKMEGSNASEYQTTQSQRVHLLKDLLTHEFPEARTLNFAHDSSWLIDAPTKTTEEIGKCLLREIKDKRSYPHLPIIFIGHSLGGIIIKQALCRSDSQNIVDDTMGIIFLGAPHQGSALSGLGAGVAWVTTLLGSDMTLLLSLTNHGAQLSNLADSFHSRIASNERRQRNVPIISFYETKQTYVRGIPIGVVVSRDSAVVHADANESHSIETDHSGLNKCRGPEDELFKKLAAAILRLKTPSLLEQADAWIRDKHYTTDRLKIERLSGESLAMDQCYINLAIVEQPGQDAGDAKKQGDTKTSPFSILVRQKVEAPDNTKQVDLATIFNDRNGVDGPRRILIRGHAGVGKTTLCKKIVYEFTKGSWSKWNALFDRVLWVPLRNLKLPERRNLPSYTLKDLFSHEFLLPTDGQNLAQALSGALKAKRSKTLFLLDGLDEVSQDLTGAGSMPRFLAELLSQPNVVITSRPSAKPPPNMDFELETIGFDPDQVNEYIEKSFTNPKTNEINKAKVDKVQSFLQDRWLIQGLVRIPVQLDALCYTWDDLETHAIVNTMTGIYKEIELKLWKKDILLLLEKRKDNQLTEEEIYHVGSLRLASFVEGEADFLECLAFTGLHNDITDFNSQYIDYIVKHFNLQLLPHQTLPLLSFLRTSNPLSEHRHRNYHFIHLTFQEYFAARYFVRQWNDRDGQLLFLAFEGANMETKVSPPAAFLRKHKYTARYDIFWRFVAGLLDGSDQAPVFINAIEEEPLDLLGPTHQRLVMHCLSEITSKLPTREALEQRLAQWLLFECKFNHSARLASEVEFPEAALRIALHDKPSDIQSTILQSLASRASIPQSIVELIVEWLDDEQWPVRVREAAVQALGGRATVPDGGLMAVAARLDDRNWGVRMAAADALGGRAVLPDTVLKVVVARLDDKDRGVRTAAIAALCKRKALPDGALTAVVARLDDKDGEVRSAAIAALCKREALPDGVLTAVVARLNDEYGAVRRAATVALGRRTTLPDEVLIAMAERLDDKEWHVQVAAIKALGRHAALPDKVLTIIVARLGDGFWKVREAAVEALAGHTALPNGVLMAVEERLDDKNQDVRVAAIKALGRRAVLPDKVLTIIVARLGDGFWKVREAAVKALGRHPAVPDGVLIAVAARLDDNNKSVQMAAANALRWRAVLPDGVLIVAAAQLNSKHIGMRVAAVEALGWRVALPDKVFIAVVACLSDESYCVRAAAVEALGGHVALPNNVFIAVVACLNDENGFVRAVAIKALGRRAAMSDGVFIAVVARLDDENGYVRTAAAEMLLSRHEILSRISFTRPIITSLYEALLRRSFKEQCSWYIEHVNSYINMPDGIAELSIDIQQKEVREWINRARPADCPSISGLEDALFINRWWSKWKWG